MFAPDLVSITLGKFDVKYGTDRIRQVLVGDCTPICEVIYCDGRMLAQVQFVGPLPICSENVIL